MPRTAAVIVFIAAAMLVLPGLAVAHELASDGQISAVLHTDPDDDPIIGQPANFLFDFDAGRVNLRFSQCDCRAMIRDGQTVLFNRKFSFSPLRPSIPGFSFIFPKRGNYTLDVTGQPTVVGAFPSFHLTWDIPVSRLPGAPATVTHSHSPIHYILDYGFVAVFAAAFIVMAAQGKLTFQQKKIPGPPAAV